MVAMFLVLACTKLPPELRLSQLPITDPALQSSLEAFTGAPIVGGNKVQILLNGTETFPAIVNTIRSAHKTITFEAYIFRRSSVAGQIVEALVDRCRAGVRAAILLDAHGSMDVPGDYVQTLQDAGCEIVPDFRPLRPWRLHRSNLRNHRRIVVVDGRVGLTGGYGIDETWTGDGRTAGHWRETNVRVEGPIVQELQAAFLEHWREATGALPGGKEFFPYPPVAVADRAVRAQVVKSSPFRENYGMYALFLQVIASAQRSILISTPYFMPGDQITKALMDAVHRGVKVVVLIPALIREAWIEFLVQQSQREGFEPLMDSGIQLYEYHPGLLHTKTMVIDGIWATVGSANFDNRSMGLNDELNLVFYDKSVAKQLEQIFIEDLGHSKKLTRDQLQSRGWLGRLAGVLASPFNNQF